MVKKNATTPPRIQELLERAKEEELLERAKEEAPGIGLMVYKMSPNMSPTMAEEEIKNLYIALGLMPPEGKEIKCYAQLPTGEWIDFSTLEAEGWTYQGIMKSPVFTQIMHADPDAMDKEIVAAKQKARAAYAKAIEFPDKYKGMEKAAAIEQFTKDLGFEKSEAERFKELSNKFDGILKIPVSAIDAIITKYFEYDPAKGKWIFKLLYGGTAIVKCPIEGVESTIHNKDELDEFLANYNLYFDEEAGIFSFLGSTIAEVNRLNRLGRKSYLNTAKVKLFDEYSRFVSIDYEAPAFGKRYRFDILKDQAEKKLEDLNGLESVSRGPAQQSIGFFVKAVLKRLETDVVNIHKKVFSKTIIMFPDVFLSDSRDGLSQSVQGAIGEVINLMLGAYKGHEQDIKSEDIDPSTKYYYETDVYSPILSTKTKTQSFDQYITRKREIAPGQWAYSFIKTGEVKTYSTTTFKTSAGKAFSSIVRNWVDALMRAPDTVKAKQLKDANGNLIQITTNDASGNPKIVKVYDVFRGSFLYLLTDTLADFEKGGHPFDKLLSGATIPLKKGVNSKGGGAICLWYKAATGTEISFQHPGYILIQPQSSIKDLFILIKMEDGMEAGKEGGLSRVRKFQVKVGRIHTQVDPTTHELLFKSKSGSYVDPCTRTVNQDGSIVYTPKASFFASGDIDADWYDVAYDSFGASCPAIVLNIAPIDSLSHAQIELLRDKVLDMIMPLTNRYMIKETWLKHFMAYNQPLSGLEKSLLSIKSTPSNKILQAILFLETFMRQQIKLSEGNVAPRKFFTMKYGNIGSELARMKDVFKIKTIKIDLDKIGAAMYRFKTIKIPVIYRVGMEGAAKKNVEKLRNIVIAWLSSNVKGAKIAASSMLGINFINALMNMARARWGESLVISRDEALDKWQQALADYGKITSGMALEWKKQIDALKEYLLNSMPAAASNDVRMENVQQNIQAFTNFLEGLVQRGKSNDYAQSLFEIVDGTDENGHPVRKIILKQDVITSLLASLNAIWQQLFPTFTGLTSITASNQNEVLAAITKWTKQILAWQAGVLDPADLGWAIMFPTIVRADTRPDFEMLLMQNNEFKLKRITAQPINGKYYFEIQRLDGNDLPIAGSERVGWFDATATQATSDTNPMNSGVGFFAKADDTRQPTLTWNDLMPDPAGAFIEPNFIAIGSANYITHIRDFKNAYTQSGA
nr:hypothetical protein [Candidatus Sigynarchaeota archaeon]